MHLPALQDTVRTMIEKAHPLPGGAQELDSRALRLHGKRYVLLTDQEAATVWDEIEKQEGGQQP